MNYFEHHIGDYDSATAHLSALEDGLYHRMLRVYYRTEAPLPLDVRQVCRLARAQSKVERDAVASLLNEFFEQRDDGWHNERCDEEIARYLDRQRKARASADARWTAHRSQSEGNADGMPTHMRSHSEGNAPRARPQSPDTNQKQELKQKPPSATPTASAVEVPDWIDSEAWLGFAEMRRRERHPLTARAAKLIFDKLLKLRAAGNDPVAVLDQSTRNGWRDVFSIRPGGPNGHDQRGGRRESVAERAERFAHEGDERERRADDSASGDAQVLGQDVRDLRPPLDLGLR